MRIGSTGKYAIFQPPLPPPPVVGGPPSPHRGRSVRSSFPYFGGRVFVCPFPYRGECGAQRRMRWAQGAYRIDRESHIRSTTSSTAAFRRRSPFPSQGKERAFVLSLFRGKSIRLSPPLLRGRWREAPDEVGAGRVSDRQGRTLSFNHLFHRRLASAVPLPLIGEGAKETEHSYTAACRRRSPFPYRGEGACVRPFPISGEEYSFVPSPTEGKAAQSAG